MKLFNPEVILRTAENRADAYQKGSPVPHAVIDNILNPLLLKGIADRFPAAGNPVWYRYDNPLEKKLATNRLADLPEIFTEVFAQLNSSVFLRYLEQLTGIQNLIPDPHLNGGGLHMIEADGMLSIHADYNYHPQTRLDRRLNVLIYLNEDWKDEYQGHFELWNKEMTGAVARYAPLFNRMVVFTVSDTAYHGHPDPLQCPGNLSRKSLAVYYYTNGRPAEEISPPHSTLYQARPGDPMTPEIVELRRKRALGRLTNSLK